MKESTTYQAILEEGKQEGKHEGSVAEARRLLLLLGTSRFGPPDAAERAAIEAEGQTERLEEWTLRLLTVSGWEELLASP